MATLTLGTKIKSCLNCKQYIPTDANVGICHHDENRATTNYGGYFPLVASFGYCNLHEEKEEEQHENS